jgi:NDP-sugar pyrophosphorylase family protein
VLAAISRRLAAAQPVAPETINRVLSFFRDFADLHHHAKEEGILFPAMEAAGLPHDAGPLAIIDGLDEPFLVVNGYTLTMLDLAEFMSFHHRSGAVATIALSKRLVNIDLGVVQLNEDEAVVGYVEKPKYEFQASMGIYMFEPRVLKYIPGGEHFDFPTLVLRLLEAGEDVAGYRFEGYWKDLGRPEDYEQAVADFERMRGDFLGVPETVKL